MIPSIGNKIIKLGESLPMSFVGYSVYDGGTASATCSKPNGTMDGDIMFAVFCSTSSYSTSSPSGWTKLWQINPNSYYFYELYYKIASGEGSSYTWSLTYGSVYVAISTYRNGFNPNSPIDTISFIKDTSAYSNYNCNAGSINVLKANSPLIYFGVVYNISSNVTFSTPAYPVSSWVENYDIGTSGYTASWFYMQSCFISSWSGSGNTGDIYTTISYPSVQSRQAFVVALRPWQ